jgi:hypothetical protein
VSPARTPERQNARKGSVVLRLIIAVVMGLAVAIGGAVLAVNVLSSHGGSTPSDSSTYNYNYGSR